MGVQNDKEILTQCIENYAKSIAKQFFGLNTMPTQSLITYVVRNMMNKYGFFIDLFVDKEGRINVDLLGDSLKSELKERGGFCIGKVKFNEKDVEDLIHSYNQMRARS